MSILPIMLGAMLKEICLGDLQFSGRGVLSQSPVSPLINADMFLNFSFLLCIFSVR